MIKLKDLLEGSSYKLMSEEMRYHYDNKISITENIFRVQSEAHFKLIAEARQLFDNGQVTFEGRDKEMFETTDVGRFATYEGKRVPLDYPMEIPLDEATPEEEDEFHRKLDKLVHKTFGHSSDEEKMNEAEYRGKKVKLGKPMSGGPKKWQVYVRNKKGNVIRVTYGQPGMKANWNDPAARKSFAARHRCHLKKDRTKAGYWACRAHKDFGRNVSGRYW